MIPHWFIRMVLAWLEFDLARAKAAPVRNYANIEWINAKIAEWELILWQKEWLLK